MVRLTTREDWTLLTIWTAADAKLTPTSRVRFAGRLDAIALGDVNGDGWTDAILAGPDVIASWLAPGMPGAGAAACASYWVAPHEFDALAVGDRDGDGRSDVAIASDDRTTILASIP